MVILPSEVSANALKWDRRFLDMTSHPKSWSKDPSTQVGALLVSHDRRTIIVGYNGFPSRLSDHESLYEHRPTKYGRILHAEENAVINARQSVEGFTLYSPVPPCTHCALIVIQAGIARCVVHTPTEDIMSRWGDSIANARELFAEAGVEYVEIEA
jgi:dCMP deaminase